MDPDKDNRDQDSQNREPKNPMGRSFLWVLLLIGAGALLFSGVLRPQKSEKTFAEFMNLLEAGEVTSVEMFAHKDELEFETKKAEEPFSVNVDKEEFRDLSKELRERKVKFKYGEPSPTENLSSLFIMALPFLLIVVFMVFMMRQAGGGAGSQVFNFGKSKARRMGEAAKVTFKDVAGVDEAKEELEEIVEFLKDPGRFSSMGARIPKGILLVGPPGSGKTLLAKAIAGEAGVPFFFMSGWDFVEMFVGVGASRVRYLFNQAKKNAPCLVFIDELDAVGRQRGAGLGGGHDEREQTLNQMLVEMDGFEPNSGVILLAATNRPDVLDPALLRPGRFDRQVVVDNPDAKGREEILRIHTRDKPVAGDIDLSKIARATVGFSGADLANICNEAAILAVRRGHKKVDMDDFNEAVERVFAGPQRKSRVMKREERYMTAIHESGHALAARFTPEAHDVHKITILPRGRALGYTMILPSEDMYSKTRAELIADIVVSLGGMVAEQVIFGDITTGAAGSDLKKVTAVARAMVMEYGMSSDLGPIAYGRKQEMVFLGRDISEERNYSEAVAEKIDKEVHDLVEVCRRRCEDILRHNEEVLLAMADVLMEEETITGDDMDRLIMEICGKAPPPKNLRQEVTALLTDKVRTRHHLPTRPSTNGNGASSGNGKGLSDTQAALVGDDDMVSLLPPLDDLSPVDEPAQPAARVEQEEQAELAAAVAPVPAPAKAPPPEDPPEVTRLPVDVLALPQAPGRLGDFLNQMADIKTRLREKLQSQNGAAMATVNAIEDLMKKGDLRTAEQRIRAAQTGAGGDLDIYLHMAMGEVLLRSERLPDAVKEYMRVLMLGAVKLGQQAERVIISFVRYLKILDQIMDKQNIALGELPQHPGAVNEANAAYQEWESRVGYPQA